MKKPGQYHGRGKYRSGIATGGPLRLTLGFNMILMEKGVPAFCSTNIKGIEEKQFRAYSLAMLLYLCGAMNDPSHQQAQRQVATG